MSALGGDATMGSKKSSASANIASSIMRKHLKQLQGDYYIFPNAEKYLHRRFKRQSSEFDPVDQNQSLSPIAAFSANSGGHTNGDSVESPKATSRRAMSHNPSLGITLTSADTYQKNGPSPMHHALAGIRALREWRQKMENSSTFVKHPKDEEEILNHMRNCEQSTPHVAQLAQIYAPHKFFGPLSLRELFVKMHCTTSDLSVNLTQAHRCLCKILSSSTHPNWEDALMGLAVEYEMDPDSQQQIGFCSVHDFEQWFFKQRKITQFTREWKNLKELLSDIDILTEDVDIYTFSLKHYRCIDNVFRISSCAHASLFTEQSSDHRIFFVVYMARQNMVHFGVSESANTFDQLLWRFGDVVPVFVEQVNHASTSHVLAQMREVMSSYLIANSQYAVPMIELKTFIAQELPMLLEQIDQLQASNGRHSSTATIRHEHSSSLANISEQPSLDTPAKEQSDLRQEVLSLATKYEAQEEVIASERERIEIYEAQLETHKEVIEKQDELLQQRLDLLKESDSMLKVKDQQIQELQTANNRLQRQIDERMERERREEEQRPTLLCLTLRRAWFEIRDIAKETRQTVYITLHTLSESGEETECQSSRKVLEQTEDDPIKHEVQWNEECLFVCARKRDALILRVWLDSKGTVGERTWAQHHITFWNQATDIYSDGESSVRWSVHVKLSKALPVHMIQQISEMHKQST